MIAVRALCRSGICYAPRWHFAPATPRKVKTFLRRKSMAENHRRATPRLIHEAETKNNWRELAPKQDNNWSVLAVLEVHSERCRGTPTHPYMASGSSP